MQIYKVKKIYRFKLAYNILFIAVALFSKCKVINFEFATIWMNGLTIIYYIHILIVVTNLHLHHS